MRRKEVCDFDIGGMTQGEVGRLLKAAAASRASGEARIARYQANPSRCKYCAELLRYEQRKNKFCSHACAGVFNNASKRGLINPASAGRKYANKECPICLRTHQEPVCCSRKCTLELNHRQIIASGVVSGQPARVKRFLTKEFGHVCQICKLTEWNGQPIPLVLDHIDGKPLNQAISNLRLVCGNCNMQLPTFAGRNVGKGGGRPYRMNRYYAGRSY